MALSDILIQSQQPQPDPQPDPQPEPQPSLSSPPQHP